MVSQARFTRAAAWLLAATLLAPSAASADPRPKDWNPSIDPANFVGTVDNQYFPLPVGRTSKFRGSTKDGIETLEIEVTSRTKTILGVTTTVMVEKHALNGQIEEISENWFAQDQAQVKSTTESSTVLQGSFSGVLVTKEWTALEPNSVEKKYYAPGIGLIMEENGPERLERVEVIG